jgi:hypothetical protein
MPKRIELASKQADGTPNWVEIRTELKARDRFAVQDVSVVTTEDGKSRASFLGLQNDMRNALLGRIITSWSFPVPVPSQNHFQAADVVIGDVMDLEDYTVLENEVEPLMDLISGRSLPDPKKPSSS